MVDWKKPIEFTYFSSNIIKRPARLLIADKKGDASESHIIAVEVDNKESIYPVNSCGCGPKGTVTNVKDKKKIKMIVYSNKSNASGLHCTQFGAYPDLAAFFGLTDYEAKYTVHEIIEREYGI